MSANNWLKIGAGLVIATDLAVTAAMPVSTEAKLIGVAMVASASAILFPRDASDGASDD